MKLNKTYILIDSENFSTGKDWRESYDRISKAIAEMVWPVGGQILRIPRIVTVKKDKSYTNKRGRILIAKQPITLRNGVQGLRSMFRTIMEAHKWRCEHMLSLAPYFEKIREDSTTRSIKLYPSGEQGSDMNESVGDFDFWDSTKSEFRTIIEWETGNISSSHRSLNKMCLALMGGIADAAVLIVPSKHLYPHLTDRIGNIRELQPYFYFWSGVGKLITRGLLAVIEVEHDELWKSTDQREFLALGIDGNAKKRKSPKKRSLRKKR